MVHAPGQGAISYGPSAPASLGRQGLWGDDADEYNPMRFLRSATGSPEYQAAGWAGFDPARVCPLPFFCSTLMCRTPKQKFFLYCPAHISFVVFK